MPLEERFERALRAVPHAASGELFWYAIMAAGGWLFFYVLFRRPLRHRRISARRETVRQMGRELFHSVCSIGVFGITGGFMLFAALSGWTRFYRDIDRYGWLWFFASVGVMIVLHDTYFYWTHRLMHHRRLYRLFHHTHHLSLSPTPWAAYAFSPFEAAVQAGIGPLIAFTVPVHPTAFLAFMLWQISFNVLGHCGYEIFPQRFLATRLGRIMNTPTHHVLHHEKFKANYSLYFNVWDRLMGTNHRDYERRFLLAAGGSPDVTADPEFGLIIPALSAPSLASQREAMTITKASRA